MSRIAELRQKLRNKPFDTAFSDFNSRVDGILEATRAASGRSAPFMENLYERFKAEQPSDADAWIATNVNGLFGSQRQPPVWITETDWCFYDDQPMTFVNQFTDAEGVEFYVFKALRKTELGERAVYKMLAYDHESKIILDGEILG